MGRVKIPLARLQQWQLTHGQVAEWVSRELGLQTKRQKDRSTGLYKLSTIAGKNRLGALELNMNHPARLITGEHSLPLEDVLFIESGRPVIARSAVVTMIDMPSAAQRKAASSVKKHPKAYEGADQQPALEIGSEEWRKQNARNAANARHNKPGGSRDKQRQIREIWASGKYTTRERCAEEESGALGMSFSAALKALRNTPDPNRASRCEACGVRSGRSWHQTGAIVQQRLRRRRHGYHNPSASLRAQGARKVT